MSTTPAGSPAAAQDSRRRVPRFALALWGLSIAVILALIAAGLLSRNRRPELPVIKEVPDFAFTHRDGTTVTREDFHGAPWIADFIFTRCAAICPRMTMQMRRVADALGEGSPVKIASFSVDPEHDTPQVLDRYAAKHGAGWYFLTGEPQAIHTLCREGFMLAVDPSPSPDVTSGGDIIHSNRFVLVDRESRIRGYYDPFDEAELKRLLDDARALLSER